MNKKMRVPSCSTSFLHYILLLITITAVAFWQALFTNKAKHQQPINNFHLEAPANWIEKDGGSSYHRVYDISNFGM
jgi:hypothetical protein